VALGGPVYGYGLGEEDETVTQPERRITAARPEQVIAEAAMLVRLGLAKLIDPPLQSRSDRPIAVVRKLLQEPQLLIPNATRRPSHQGQEYVIGREETEIRRTLSHPKVHLKAPQGVGTLRSG